jgi:cation diffusion facilitator CzcD-associated flavoprotein CzcO
MLGYVLEGEMGKARIHVVIVGGGIGGLFAAHAEFRAQLYSYDVVAQAAAAAAGLA